MGRSPRVTEPGLAYHVLNRRVMRLPLFRKSDDYLAFERASAESLERPDAPRLPGWPLVPNHRRLVVHAGDAEEVASAPRGGRILRKK